MLPEGGAGKGGVWFDGITDETARGVGVEGEHEDDEEVVGVIEGFEGLLADFAVRGGVHQEHAEEHDVPGDAAGLCVVDLDGGFFADLGAFDGEEAGGGGLVAGLRQVEGDGKLLDVVGCGVDNGEEEHAVRGLAMEPLEFVQRDPFDLWSKPGYNVSAHGEQN